MEEIRLSDTMSAFSRRLGLCHRRLRLFRTVAMALEPRQRLDQTLAKRSRRLKSEFALGPGRVQATSRLAIGLAGVPANFTLKATQITNQLRQGANRDFET